MKAISDRSDNILRFDRRFDAPPELVFALWTEPALFEKWFASSHGFEATVVELDARPGGRWRILNRKGDVSEHPHGVFHEVVPASRLVYSYRFEGTDFHSTISVELSPDSGGTRMRFCQSGFPDAGARHEHDYGWSYVWRLFGDVLAAQHGVGTAYPNLTPERISGVGRDLAEARRRLEEESAAKRTGRG
jgi:uncharacterized protein YndB with AHSA1/START domain